MDPIAHAALAYFSYVAYAIVRGHPLPARLALWPLAFGSQLPDLIDKPLAYIQVLAYGRSLAHSVFAFLFISILVWVVALRLHGRWESGSRLDRLRVASPGAIAIGYGSHLVGDVYAAVLRGAWWDVRFLLYPLYRVPESSADAIAPWIRVVRIYQNPGSNAAIEVILVAIVVFVAIRVYAVAREW